MLYLRTSGTSTPIRAATLVQAATLGEGVRDFLFDAFLHVARHERPPRATPDGESPPPTESRIWVPPIDWGRHLVGHPLPGRVDTKGRTRYHEPDMAHPPPDATPDSTKEWERETWVARMASLGNFQHHVPGDIPTPDEQQPAPSTYMTLMYNLRACWCWRGGVVSAARARGLLGGWPYLLQDVRVCLLEVVEGLEEASLDAGHVLLCEVGVVLGGGVGARPQQRHEAGCHHVRA